MQRQIPRQSHCHQNGTGFQSPGYPASTRQPIQEQIPHSRRQAAATRQGEGAGAWRRRRKRPGEGAREGPGQGRGPAEVLPLAANHALTSPSPGIPSALRAIRPVLRHRLVTARFVKNKNKKRFLVRNRWCTIYSIKLIQFILNSSPSLSL